MLNARQETLAALQDSKALRERNRQERAAWVCRLARQGETPTEIRRRCRLQYDTVRRILAEAGIAPTLRPGASRAADG
jgi:hypothetical protein